MKYIFLLALVGVLLWGQTSAEKKDEEDDDVDYEEDNEEVPVLHMALLQFSLDGDDPYEFAAYATEFGETIKEILIRDSEFVTVNAVVLGVGKTDCGISVIAVVEYTLNSTSAYEDNNSILQHIVDLIDANKDMFEDIYSIKDVKTVDTAQATFKYVNQSSSSMTTVLGVAVGALALIGLSALAVGLVMAYTLNKKTYEKVPLLADEGTARKWLSKLPWTRRNKNVEDPEF